jgi:K+-transporting ATPase A subunit
MQPLCEDCATYHFVSFATARTESNMSINTLTTNAVVARALQGDATIDTTKIAPTASGPLSTISNFIPTEVIAVYIAALNIISQAKPPGYAQATIDLANVVTFWLCLILTPLAVWAAFAVKLKSASGSLPADPRAWPWWSTFAATLSFVVWAFALPNSGLAGKFLGEFGNLAAGISVLVVGMALSLFDPLFSSPQKPSGLVGIPAG